MNDHKRLVVLLGPTGVGKTDLSIRLSEYFDAPIVSADSRQFFRELKIGTAPPTESELVAAPHYFIQNRSITEDYNAGAYGEDALRLIGELFKNHSNILLVGGSGMYIDAVCEGFDRLPKVDKKIRGSLSERYKNEGLEPLLEQLKELDPDYYETVDRNNPARVIRALEVCLVAGVSYSGLRSGKSRGRDFEVVKIGLDRPREELYERINQRADAMMEAGLLGEARELYPFREKTALKTVGYSELFDYLDGKYTLQEAVDIIKRNSRRYAKRQMTWFRRDESAAWFSPDNFNEIREYLNEHN